MKKRKNIQPEKQYEKRTKENHLEIKIDDKVFILICKYTHLKIYSYVVVECNKKRYAYYNSYSEMNMYRLAFTCINCPGNPFYKGLHYTLSSTMHADLQLFIMENIDKIPECDENEINVSVCEIQYLNCQDPHDQCKKIQCHLEDINRMINISELSFIWKCSPINDFFYDKRKYVYEKIGMSKECTNKYQLLYNYIKTQGYYNYISHLPAPEIQKHDANNFIELLRIYYKIMSDIFEKYFKISDNFVDFKGSYIINEGFKIAGSLYEISIEVLNKINYKYRVIINKYKFFDTGTDFCKEDTIKCRDKNSNEMSITDKEYSFVCIIVPYDAKITEFGTYDKILNTGMYTYKPMDYQSNMQIFGESDIEKIPDDLIQKSRCIRKKIGYEFCYLFYGDIMNDVLPLNMFQDLKIDTRAINKLQTLIQYGGNIFSYKYLKYKKKYLESKNLKY